MAAVTAAGAGATMSEIADPAGSAAAGAAQPLAGSSFIAKV